MMLHHLLVMCSSKNRDTIHQYVIGVHVHNALGRCDCDYDCDDDGAGADFDLRPRVLLSKCLPLLGWFGEDDYGEHDDGDGFVAAAAYGDEAAVALSFLGILLVDSSDSMLGYGFDDAFDRADNFDHVLLCRCDVESLAVAFESAVA